MRKPLLWVLGALAVVVAIALWKTRPGTTAGQLAKGSTTTPSLASMAGFGHMT